MYLPGHRIRVYVGEPCDAAPVSYAAIAATPAFQIAVKGISVKDSVTDLEVTNNENVRGYDGQIQTLPGASTEELAAVMMRHVIAGVRDGKLTLMAPSFADNLDGDTDAAILWPYQPDDAAAVNPASGTFRRGDNISLKLLPNKANTDVYYVFTCMLVTNVNHDADSNGEQPLSVELTNDGYCLFYADGVTRVIA